MTSNARINQMTIGQFEAIFPDDEACKTYLLNCRWPDGVVCCPRCGNEKVNELKAKPFHWQCRRCNADGYRFSVLVNTIFENTNKGLHQWFRIIHTMLTNTKGVSAHHIYRTMEFGSYRTAWSMCHKIRTALMDTEFQWLMGIVEVDATYVGGEAKRHKDKRGSTSGAGSASGKDLGVN